jgi:anti-anti-sigma regulatory factor
VQKRPPSVPSVGGVTVRAEGRERVLRLSGEIDDGVIGAFIDQRLETERGANGPLITAVDMAEVTLLSSSASNFLLRQTHLVG